MRCLIEFCDDHEYARGVCRYHWTAMLEAVKKGVRTWAEFEKFGMANPAKKYPVNRDDPEWMKIVKERDKERSRRRYYNLKATSEGRALLKEYWRKADWKKKHDPVEREKRRRQNRNRYYKKKLQKLLKKHYDRTD